MLSLYMIWIIQNLGFIHELLIILHISLQLNSHVVKRPYILTLVQDAKAALAKFAANFEFVSDKYIGMLITFLLYLLNSHIEMFRSLTLFWAWKII